jgi:hypothetical protein
MTIDKIKHYMKPNMFNYWTALVNGSLPYDLKVEALRKAKNKLEKEINSGLLQGIEYTAELNYLNLLLK